MKQERVSLQCDTSDIKSSADFINPDDLTALSLMPEYQEIFDLRMLWLANQNSALQRAM